MSKKYLFAFAGLCAFITSDFANANCVKECHTALEIAAKDIEKANGVAVSVDHFVTARNHREFDCKTFCAAVQKKTL